MFLPAASPHVLLLKPRSARRMQVLVSASCWRGYRTSDFCRVCSSCRVYRDCEMLRVGVANGLKTAAQPYRLKGFTVFFHIKSFNWMSATLLCASLFFFFVLSVSHFVSSSTKVSHSRRSNREDYSGNRNNDEYINHVKSEGACHVYGHRGDGIYQSLSCSTRIICYAISQSFEKKKNRGVGREGGGGEVVKAEQTIDARSLCLFLFPRPNAFY